ncbi:hypothetical protein PYW07_000350 [Mythimna separata]|uniref:Uncharacterized protein n=1 Tax=Mythimna separata TaxID=271217 RepID=A0AAD7Z4D8_MYTSE|nr:hypothetical protein PYW07_000347 [Mythimna separata]KAJ8737079.1 hypothetical protein PYW07_000350 [Mythimna separata]
MSTLEEVRSAQKNLEECVLGKMDELEAQIQSAGPAKDTVAKVREEFRSFRELIFGLLGLLRKQIAECSRVVDSLETCTRRKALIFTGYTEADKEDCRALVLDTLHNKLALKDITTTSIKVCHRLGAPSRGPTRSRPILVRFSDIDHKSAVWKAKSALKGSPIAVKEFLTRVRQAVFSKARLHFGMSACWTQDGVIVIRTPDGTRLKITSMEELNPLLIKYPKKAGESSSSSNSGVRRT